ncbi:uncharacterized protein LOC131269916 [Anopheles coustani]|uniref:uncharacterized protein LOC131269916 n=1 Tax=Anopheles coustani TaxID=139045 RepID=UPI00265A54D9|nr:uncharacterized protein LOC131269916 [Anopheles coustani]
MIKRAFILCTPHGDALIHNGKVHKCKSEDGLKEFIVERALLENVGNEPFLVMIDGTVYSIPTDEYIPVHEDKAPLGGQDPTLKSSLKTRHQQTIYQRFGNLRWWAKCIRH